MESRPTRTGLSLALAALAAGSTSAHSQDVMPAAAVEPPGVALSADFITDFRRNTTGGLERGNAFSNYLKLDAAWHTSRLPGAHASGAISVIRTGGDAISGRYVGDLQGLNNIEAAPAWRLYEFWSEFSFGAEENVSTRAGYLDLNAEFDTAITSAFFVGPPFGIGSDLGQTGNNGPAVFPVTSLGLRVQGHAGSAALWRAAVYDGVPGDLERDSFVTFDVSRDQGALVIGELELLHESFHKIALGAWTYTSSFVPLNAADQAEPALESGNSGFYALVDKPLGDIGGAHFDGVLRAGFADARFNAIHTYVGAAVVTTGFFGARPEDGIGLAFAHGRTGGMYREALALNGGLPAPAETTFELTYRAPLAEWLSIAPSAQWVHAPGGDRQVDDAAVIGLRFELTFDKSLPITAF